MTPPLDARARRSQRALLRAGLELLNTNRLATLSDIATHAGVGRTTLYRQYETREKLISAIAVYCLELIDEVTDPIEKQATSALDAIHLLFDLVMPLTQEFQFLMNLDRMVEDDPEIIAINARQKKDMVALVEYGKNTGEIDKSLPTSWVINCIEGMFIVGWMQQKEGKYSTQQIASLAFTSFCNGVSSS